MDANKTKPLDGLRVLLPPSRLERNPLVPMFARTGADEVVALVGNGAP